MGHNYNDSINFSFKKDLETIKSLPKEKRWKYIWDYYKIIILVLPVALIVLLILGSFCVNMVKGTFFPKDPVSIGIAVSGCSASPDWLQGCEEAIGYDPKREYLQILESPPYSTERDDFVIKSTLWLTAGQPDIFIVDEDGYEYLLSLDILVDLSRDWPVDSRRIVGHGVHEHIRAVAACRRFGNGPCMRLVDGISAAFSDYIGYVKPFTIGRRVYVGAEKFPRSFAFFAERVHVAEFRRGVNMEYLLVFRAVYDYAALGKVPFHRFEYFIYGYAVGMYAVRDGEDHVGRIRRSQFGVVFLVRLVRTSA